MTDRFFPSRWDNHFMRLAREASLMSKDPSTKVGAVIVKDRRVVGTGFNGFPKGIADDARLDDRQKKYELIVHAEMNALLDAGREADGATLYLYGFRSAPCLNCCKHLIQSGVKCVVAWGPELPGRWVGEVEKAAEVLEEADVGLVLGNPEDGWGEEGD